MTRTIGLVLLILIVPVLFSTPRDDRSVQAHLATCPNCSGLESNPTHCKVVMAIGRPGYEGERPSQPALAEVAAPRKVGRSHRHEGSHVAAPERQPHHHEKPGRI